MRQRFYFCPKCGGRLEIMPRHGRLRLICQSCSYVMYENPVVGVAAIVWQEGKILLGRRGKDSTYPGLWCIPCGYVEYDEDVHDAIIREFKEETGLHITLERVFTVQSNFHNPESHTVGIWFIASVVGGKLCPGDDIDKVEYYPLDQIPALAFPTDAVVIRRLRENEDKPTQKNGKEVDS